MRGACAAFPGALLARVRRAVLHPILLSPCAPEETTRDAVEAAFSSYLARGDVGLIIVNAPIADMIRPAILAHTDKVPMVLEIPAAGGASKASTTDPIMRRVMQMLGQDL